MVTAEQFKSPYYNIKNIINKKGKTQAEIADQIGMDRSTFNLKINRTNGRDFSFGEAIKLASVLEENIDYFF
ncbi:hypothetical protein A5881_002931 [Enterococcus termitis]|nr:hypothetical protein A5881_002414 [Enterococcus termitis]